MFRQLRQLFKSDTKRNEPMSTESNIRDSIVSLDSVQRVETNVQLLQSLDVALERCRQLAGEGTSLLEPNRIRNLLKECCDILGIKYTEPLLDHLLRDAQESWGNADGKFPRDALEKIVKNFKLSPRLQTRHPKLCVTFGGGAFGTAVSSVLARKGHKVIILMRPCEQEHADSINNSRCNTMCFPDEKLPAGITATTSVKDAFVEKVDIIVHATPVPFSRDFLGMIKECNVVEPGVPFLSTSKGIAVKDLSFMHQIITDIFPDNPVVAMSGPSFAKGLLTDESTLVSLACTDERVAYKMQHIISSPTFRAYTSTDVIGLEVAGALKNVLAISLGLVEGLGMGPNTQCSLLSRAWQEVQALAIAMGGKLETLVGLGGLGDLMMTCFGGLSRNARFGNLLAKGTPVEEALKEVVTVEGYPTAGAVVRLAARYNVKVPILNALYRALEGDISAHDVIVFISSMPLTGEFDQGPSSVR